MKHNILTLLMMLSLILASCTPSPENVSQSLSLPNIYPDYIDVTIPDNIAPLNFLLRDSCEAILVSASCDRLAIKSHRRGNEAIFNMKDWRNLMKNSSGDSISVSVTALHNGKWTEYKPFTIHVSTNKIDPYLTYRLIEPDYEVFSRLQIVERNIEDFSERVLCDYNAVGNRCMNCHTHAPAGSKLSFFYVRGDGGGMILNDHGNLRLLNFKTPDMVSGSVYAQFDSSARFITFSTNAIIPAFHSRPEKRLEVFDTKSDVYVYDLLKDTVIRSPLLADSLSLETFPAFSPDSKSIFFCTAEGTAVPSRLDSVQYSLCRIPFDPVDARIGNSVDTIIKALPGVKNSVSHPNVSPDGRFILYTVADFGTFPIWHREADLRMLNLKTGEINTLDIVNSDMSDTYHCWSSSGRWFVFASKRDDGLYGKPYFAHVSIDGKVSKPFLLPQESPLFYDCNLKSFNVPDLGLSPAAFTPSDVSKILNH